LGNLISKIQTYKQLGLANVARVAAYRAALRLGVHPVLKLKHERVTGPFFTLPVRNSKGLIATEYWRDTRLLFARHEMPLEGVPDWHANPFSSGVRADSQSHWSSLPDFDPHLGDIKTIWEASRFDWAISMAQRAVCGDRNEISKLNYWFEDWIKYNAPYMGVNWKCGQEVSIRVLHTVVVLLILGSEKQPLPGLLRFLRLHLQRIEPTISYAIAQQNNHGTSEAAALFVGGAILVNAGDHYAVRWMNLGRKWLEDRANTLIEEDGTFSQYSVTYHRMMLDTYAIVECCRRRLSLPAFSAALEKRLASATIWLNQFTDHVTGGAPNLGANDGARLIPLSQSDYRDFRPSLQLAAALFCNARAIPAFGLWDQPLEWLGIDRPMANLADRSSVSLEGGGFHILRSPRAVAYLRYPRFRFRPSQADALHLDLWVDGQNLLRDAGSFSYNADQEVMAYFNGAPGHNLAEFDGRDQMPRLSRFMLGAWLEATDVNNVALRGDAASAGYIDYRGARHYREIRMAADQLVCIDELGGLAKKAVLRWRLPEGNWYVDGNSVIGDLASLHIEADNCPLQIGLEEGSESLHYFERTSVTVVEVAVKIPSKIITSIRY
jgi:hypothetical protein